MPAKKMTREEVVAMLRKRQNGRSDREFAEELGISQSYLSEIMKGTRGPGEKVLEILGLTKEITYVSA